MGAPKAIFLMADYGHDPTETAVPFLAFKEAGFDVSVATEHGTSPQCDAKMLTGWTQKLLGATKDACKAYERMIEDAAVEKPLSWTATDFSLDEFNLVFLPGGHEKGVRQVIDSPVVHKMLAAYFPQTRKPSTKAVAAVCHGVLVLSETTLLDGKSALHDVVTTTLPAKFEDAAYWGTRLFLGDYYKTYGAGSENVEDSVKKRLDDPSKQFKVSMQGSPFVVQDERYNYISARFPPDAALLAERTILLVNGCSKGA